MFSQSISPLLIIITIWILIAHGTLKDYDVVKFEITTFPGSPMNISVASERTKNREYKFNVTFILLDDPRKYDIEVSMSRSLIGNNKFIMSPFRIPRKATCDSLSNEFRAHLMDDISKYSNLPCNHDRNVDYCDLLEVNHQYEVINYAASIKNVPKFTPSGTYKFILNIIDRKTKQITATMLVISRLY